MNITITGIHTGIGKTITSAVIAEALGADYWKPIQAGIEETDTAQLARLLTNGAQRVHKEAVLLTQPLSPHAAADIDKVTVDHTQFTWPQTTRPLIVETAGGVLSPVSARATVADMVAHFGTPTILVVQHYLGSISHTLLCIEVLKSRGIPLMGLVINGHPNVASTSFITQYTQVPVLAEIPHFAKLDNSTVATFAAQIRTTLTKNIADAQQH